MVVSWFTVINPSSDRLCVVLGKRTKSSQSINRRDVSTTVVVGPRKNVSMTRWQTDVYLLEAVVHNGDFYRAMVASYIYIWLTYDFMMKNENIRNLDTSMRERITRL